MAATRCTSFIPAVRRFLYHFYSGGYTRRHVFVAERRTALDFAGWLMELVDVHYPAAETIRLVVDNLNTHVPAALYAAFPAPEARRIARKIAFHDTPTHGSWLNMVEIELSVLAAQCLDRRLV